MTPDSVVLYDPNSLNPYGLELANVLASAGRHVDWLVPTQRAHAVDLPTAVTFRPVLASAAEDGEKVAGRVLRRIWGPLRACWYARRARMVIVWTRDPWDVLVFILLSLFSQPLFVHHNPPSLRAARGLRTRLERLLAKRSRVCAHSELIMRAAGPGIRDLRLTPHPNYTRTSAAAPPRDPQPRIVAFLGALRRDKGAADIMRVLDAIDGPFVFRTIGRGSLDDESVASLSRRSVRYEVIGGARPASEVEMLAALSTTSVVVAPYSEVTESGSALLCLALGVPVLGLDRGSLRTLLTPMSQASTPEGLGELTNRFLTAPWTTFAITSQEQEARAQHGWIEALT